MSCSEHRASYEQVLYTTGNNSPRYSASAKASTTWGTVRCILRQGRQRVANSGRPRRAVPQTHQHAPASPSFCARQQQQRWWQHRQPAAAIIKCCSICVARGTIVAACHKASACCSMLAGLTCYDSCLPLEASAFIPPAPPQSCGCQTCAG